MNGVERYLEEKLEQRKQAGNLRRLKTQHQNVDLFSNDYLGLATNGIIANALKDMPVEKQLTGSTGSRLLSGNTIITEQLETTIAAFHNADAALLFNSGYDANIGLIASISNRHTNIFYDELSHASIIDGTRLCQCKDRQKFKHNDINDLAGKLKKTNREEPIIVIVESVYSMDGDIAPLKELATLCETYKASLIVDEAHATGIFGNKGAGVVCDLGLEKKVFARVHTYGKALGCHGAAVVGNDMLKQFLINFARSFIYTTALPLHAVYAIRAAYEYLSLPSFSNARLHELIADFRKKFETAEQSQWVNSISPIQALVVNSNEKATAIAGKLQEAGLQVNPILYPTVPLGMERLRVCLHSFNTHEQIDLLFETIKKYQ